MQGGPIERWAPRGFTNAPVYEARAETSHVLMKVETHNHPTAISPFPGASTGAGGEIRDEGATGRGARPEGRAHRLQREQPASARHQRAVGAARHRQARTHRQRAADHDRGAARRRRVQQRVRPAQPRRLLSRLRAAGGRRAARLSQADHDRRRPRRDQRRRRPTRTIRRRHAAGPARRPGHAHRHGRRRGELDGRRQQHRRARLRLGAARQPRDPAPRAGGHQPLLAARRRTTRSSRSTTWAPAASATRSPNWWTAPARAPRSTCARCRSKKPASRPKRSGATRARSAT